ncbi:transposase [Mesorhizobium sp. L2C084A000]|uniref:transposase n=1 Tax=Mesorhizobium sp. L2C084A000 TaxID=1287116 RepID=UPI001FD9DE61|nr:transposase [Mesorhizobium sp. L2C084A000]
MDIATGCRQVTRLEIIDTGRRRRWSEGEKVRIVKAHYSAPRQASATARRHGISTPLLFAWRKAHREGRLGEGRKWRLRFRASDDNTGAAKEESRTGLRAHGSGEREWPQDHRRARGGPGSAASGHARLGTLG